MESKRQVYIGFDPPDGLVMQVEYGEWHRYWRLLGWEYVGVAQPLPRFEALVV